MFDLLSSLKHRKYTASGVARETSDRLVAINRSQATVEFDIAGTILDANENFLRLMDYRLDEVVGRHHSVFVEEADAASPDYAAFWDVLRAGRCQAAEFKRVAKGGRRVWIRAAYAPLLDEAGKPYRILKLATDVTASKLEAAEHAGQIEAINRSQAVVSFDMDGHILAANANFLNLMGYETTEVVGRHHRMFVPEPERSGPEYTSFWTRLRHGEFFSAEFKRIAKDGKEVWIRASYNPILDSDGKPFKVVKFASDVTADRLKSADHEGQVAAISRSQAVIEFDLSGRILSANENFLKAVGYEEQDVIGAHHSIFMPPGESTAAAYTEFWEKLRRGKYFTGEYLRHGKSAREVWIQASYNPIFDLSGKPFKIVKYATDITQEVKRRKIMSQLSLVANGTDNSVIITDAQRRIEYVNAGFERLTGYAASEVLGKRPGEILQGPHTDPATVDRIRSKLDRGEAFYEEILNYSRAGVPYWISLGLVDKG